MADPSCSTAPPKLGLSTVQEVYSIWFGFFDCAHRWTRRVNRLLVRTNAALSTQHNVKVLGICEVGRRWLTQISYLPFTERVCESRIPRISTSEQDWQEWVNDVEPKPYSEMPMCSQRTEMKLAVWTCPFSLVPEHRGRQRKLDNWLPSSKHCGERFACARLARSPLTGLVPDFQLGWLCRQPTGRGPAIARRNVGHCRRGCCSTCGVTIAYMGKVGDITYGRWE